MTQLLLFNVFNGLIVGAFYALMALGLSLILNLSGVINFAHGGFLAIGAYIAYTLIPYIGFWGGLLVAAYLSRHAAGRPIPWVYFWAAGGLSSFEQERGEGRNSLSFFMLSSVYG